MLYLFAFIFCLTASLCLSLAMPKHYRQVFNYGRLTDAKKQSFRVSGYAQLAIALFLCLQMDITGVAISTFFGMLTVTLLMVAITLGLTSK